RMPDLQTFVATLEREGELARVRAEVDPQLEISEIVSRVVREQGKALLFERVKGSDIPLVINILGSARRIELALGRHPQQVGEDFRRLMETAKLPSLRNAWNVRDVAGRILSSRPRNTTCAAVHECSEPPNLARLPIM